MRVEFPFASEVLGFDVAADALIGTWLGPESGSRTDLRAMVAEALNSPRDFPPLREAVVPGDHIVLAWDAQILEPLQVLSAIVDALGEGGVEPANIRVVTPAPGAKAFGVERPAGTTLSVHDSGDSASTSYLASTTLGRRIYLNRHLIDADAVVAVGRLGFDAGFGRRGPWSALYPSLGNAEATSSEAPTTDELAEVSWLLGSPFQVGLLDGVEGTIEVIAGLDREVRSQGEKRIEDLWTFQVDRRPDLVVVGVGSAAGIDELAMALEAACKIVRRGGKIVALSRVAGPLRRACSRLLGIDDPRLAAARLKGLEGEPDFAAARRLARSLAWADVYLLSNLGDSADDLVTAALGRPEEARRLVASSESVVFLAAADRTRAVVIGESEGEGSA